MQAVIFDMDGVLVDSEPVITKAAKMALGEFGLTVQDEDFHPFTGMGEDRFIGGVSEKYGMPYQLEMKARTYTLYLELVNEEIGRYPGIPDLLTALSGMGLRLAVASSADAVKVHANLPAAGIDPGAFDAICSGEDVQNKKPAPDIFLLAAEKLGVEPEACLVVEDAVSGVKAAKAAGMVCVGIASSFDKVQLLDAGADGVLNRTRELVEWLRNKGLSNTERSNELP